MAPVLLGLARTAPEPIAATITSAANEDDGYLYGESAGSTFNTSQNSLYVGTPGRSFLRMKLPNDLQPGATVTAAHLNLWVRYTSPATPTVVSAYAADNADAPTDGTEAVAQLATLTTANVEWTLPAAEEDDPKGTSPNIASVIQEIINRPGYTAGDHIVLWLTPGSSQCRPYAFTTATTNFRPHLDLEWTNAPG